MNRASLLLASFIALFSAPAFAYIDPGSGSAIMSAIAGLLVAITMAIKGYWYKIKSFFIKPKSKSAEKDSAANTAE